MLLVCRKVIVQSWITSARLSVNPTHEISSEMLSIVVSGSGNGLLTACDQNKTMDNIYNYRYIDRQTDRQTGDMLS